MPPLLTMKYECKLCYTWPNGNKCLLHFYDFRNLSIKRSNFPHPCLLSRTTICFIISTNFRIGADQLFLFFPFYFSWTSIHPKTAVAKPRILIYSTHDLYMASAHQLELAWKNYMVQISHFPTNNNSKKNTSCWCNAGHPSGCGGLWFDLSSEEVWGWGHTPVNTTTQKHKLVHTSRKEIALCNINKRGFCPHDVL